MCRNFQQGWSHGLSDFQMNWRTDLCLKLVVRAFFVGLLLKLLDLVATHTKKKAAIELADSFSAELYLPQSLK